MRGVSGVYTSQISSLEFQESNEVASTFVAPASVEQGDMGGDLLKNPKSIVSVIQPSGTTNHLVTSTLDFGNVRISYKPDDVVEVRIVLIVGGWTDPAHTYIDHKTVKVKVDIDSHKMELMRNVEVFVNALTGDDYKMVVRYVFKVLEEDFKIPPMVLSFDVDLSFSLTQSAAWSIYTAAFYLRTRLQEVVDKEADYLECIRYLWVLEDDLLDSFCVV